MAPKKKASGKAQNSVPDSDHIVFSDKTDKKKKQNNNQIDTSTAPRPDVRKVIGGASWTGKLPVNLLSELCQRERWDKPDYSMRQMAGHAPDVKNFRSVVTLSKTEPKTGEKIKIPPFQLPESHASLADQLTALEARHFAAAYTLFRVSSMKNVHLSLPPKYRDLWKGPFQELKADDVVNNKGWRYDADPFAAEAKRQEIIRAIEKREAEERKTANKQESTNITLQGFESISAKSFTNAPRLDLGQNLRTELETLARRNAVWNAAGKSLSVSELAKVQADLTESGFRTSHVREAFDFCGTPQEVLEWLLIHVPEDDLPSWCLPPNYSAGVSLASDDLAKDAKLKRLARAGYSSHLCMQALRENAGNELAALEALQSSLVSQPVVDSCVYEASQDNLWQEEVVALEAVLDKRLIENNQGICAIISQYSPGKDVTFRFYRPSAGYPTSSVPIITLDADSIPAYIRLNATKQAAKYAWQNLLGDSMLYNLIEWLETTLPAIINNPGSLVDLDITSESLRLGKIQKIVNNDHPKESQFVSNLTYRSLKKDKRSSSAIKQASVDRQKTEQQRKMNRIRESLPAWTKRVEIVQAVSTQQVTLITGSTGSGKSSQAVQFVLDDAINKGIGRQTNIICTQPRRVAALSLSDRVSFERCSREGDEVGHIIRGSSKLSPSTKITFMTTGVLLRQLQQQHNDSSSLNNISHIFVDEVHERSLDTDFLLVLLKDAMAQNPSLKIVLMSATVDADIFTSYFGGNGHVARVHIEGRSFPVHDFYLDEVMTMTNSVKTRAENGGSNDEDFDAGMVPRRFSGGIDFELITRLVQHIDRELGSADGAILIFLPGTLEIDRCLKDLSKMPHVLALPLHASLLPMEQKKVFPRAPQGKRKVIAATNVAETSITIEDIVAVIDTGRVKETSYDIASNIVRLQEVWASQAACKQRQGRAGRVRAGDCYKLFTRNIEATMQPVSIPEIHRVPLEQLCLSVKASAPKADVSGFLNRTLSPPSSGAVINALHNLNRMGALDDDHLTGLGIYMSMIPADLRCAKLIIYGSVFACLEACLTLSAILTVRSPFVAPRDKREAAKEARTAFLAANGDLLLDRTAFDEWKNLISTLPTRDCLAWCSSKFLSNHTLREIDSTRRQLLDSLKETGLVPVEYSTSSGNVHKQLNLNDDNMMLLRALIAGSLNPQIAEIKFPDKKYIASMSGAKELDPEAKTIKYYNEENGRVFIHPSSVLFDAQSFSGGGAFISYFTKLATSKNFIRDLTPLNAYSLLLFGGAIEVDISGAGLIVDGWLRFRGWSRIGVLISRLRGMLDQFLRHKVDNPGSEVQDGGVLAVVRRLVEFNGQDQ